MLRLPLLCWEPYSKINMQSLQAIKQRYGIIGDSPALMHALDTATRVAPTDLSILISGESGVGKEVFSKVIHGLSPRKHNPIIEVNCGAIPPGTINSELFGHEKGAFTGASAERKGYFETVNGGTIFLDEIGEMPLDTQSYLLRVLETGDYIRVGSSVTKHTDVRIIAATNVDLTEKIKEGKFREDLYYRLNTVPIHVPALRERKQDIPTLFRKFSVDFAEKYSTSPKRLTEDAVEVLVQYPWPGNIRELKNVAEQVNVLATTSTVNAEELLSLVPILGQAPNRLPVPAAPTNDMHERDILYNLLFDMKEDLNHLKAVVNGLIRSNDLVLDPKKVEFDNNAATAYRQLTAAPQNNNAPTIKFEEGLMSNTPTYENEKFYEAPQEYDEVEVVDNNLSLEDMEKEYITRALLKHNGRRRDAAKELGISERTLYRKIKQYEIEE